MITSGFNQVLEYLTIFSSGYLALFMLAIFVVAIAAKVCIFYLIKSEHNFASEFEKRVYRHMDNTYPETVGLQFYDSVKFLLEKTQYEIFTLKNTRRTRKFDSSTALVDRVLGIEQGTQRIVDEAEHQLSFWRKSNSENPDFHRTTTYIMNNNPHFSKISLIFPVDLLNNLLNVLPGLFIIGGIFGTFIGITTGLPSLTGMDLSNIAEAQKTLDNFLLSVGFAMYTSVVGILLSVLFTVINTMFSPNTHYLGFVDKFENSLDALWLHAINEQKNLKEDSSTFSKVG